MDTESPHTVLMVLDDDALFVEKLTRMLRATDWTVLGFTDPDDARAYISGRNAVNILLVDSQMPQIDGITFLEKLDGLAPKPDVIAVLVSEIEPRSDVMQRIQTLGVGFLTKDSLRRPEVLQNLLADSLLAN